MEIKFCSFIQQKIYRLKVIPEQLYQVMKYLYEVSPIYEIFFIQGQMLLNENVNKMFLIPVLIKWEKVLFLHSFYVNF